MVSIALAEVTIDVISALCSTHGSHFAQSALGGGRKAIFWYTLCAVCIGSTMRTSGLVWHATGV